MNDPAASTGSSSSHDAIKAREKFDAIIAEIHALGHLPKQRKQPKDEAEAAETRLAKRLQKAKQHAEWSSQYDTRLQEIAMAEVQPAHEAGAEELISEIKALGRLPRQLKKPTTEAEAVMLLQLLLMLLLLLPLLLLLLL